MTFVVNRPIINSCKVAEVQEFKKFNKVMFLKLLFVVIIYKRKLA